MNRFLATFQALLLASALLLAGTAGAGAGAGTDTAALRRAAAGGDPAAAAALAEALLIERGGPADAEIVALLERGVAAGVPRAQAVLGAVLLFGAGVPRDHARAVPLLEAAAASGDNEARYNLALALEYGAAGAPDLERALALLREAADDGLAAAMHGVGVYYLKGLGVPADAGEAERWFRRGVAAGSLDAAVWLADLLLDADPDARGLEEAVSLLENATRVGHEAASMRLVGLLLEGKHVPADPARARALLEHSAAAGSARAAWTLGVLLLDGKHLPEDPEAGMQWLRQAAEAGVADAQHLLAAAYLSGDGVEPDPQLHEHWLRRAAAGGSVRAQAELEALQRERRLRDSVPAALVARLRSAAERGEAGAAFELGMLARHGRGMERDLGQARRWLAQAADAGVVAARRELGRLAIEGSDEQRRAEGATLLAAAAEAGDAEAQYRHGRALQFGIGVAADPGQALRRLEQAALHGHFDARLALAQSLWRGSRSQRDQALAWLLWPAGHTEIASLEYRAGEYARGRDAAIPADPAFALLLAGIAARLGDDDAVEGRDDIGARVDADQRRDVDKALARWQALRAEPHPQLAWRESMAQATALQRDDAAAARAQAERAEQAAAKAFGKRSLPRAAAIELRADIARVHDDDAAAREAYDQALALRLSLQPEDHGNVIDNRRMRALAGDWAERARELPDLLPRATRRHGEGSTELQALHADIGNALYYSDREAAAVPHLRLALELALRDPLRQRPDRLARARGELGRALAKSGSVDEGVALLEDAVEALRVAGPEWNTELHEAIDRLVLALWNAGRAREAADRQSELIALLEAEMPHDLQRLASERRILDAIRADAVAGAGTAAPDRARLLAAAESGDSMAQLLLADHLLSGRFGAVDAEGAVRWYRRSAEGGEAIAQYNLAILLGEGRGVARDPVEALAWARRAAAQDFPDALATLGYYLTDGEGDDDPGEAVRLFERGAAMGSASAMFNLGNHLIEGIGVERDVVRALLLYRQAADGGEPAAVRTLALMQIEGDHMPRDLEAGRDGLLEAARLGDEEALGLACALARDGALRWKDQRIALPAGTSVDPGLAANCPP